MATDALAVWHDFYLLLGGGAATLVGLTFVAASIIAGAVQRDHEQGLNVFITPTVLHFTAILVACLIAVAPIADPGKRGALLLALSIVGIGYSARVWLNMYRRGYAATVVLSDRLWYALAPVFAYAAVAAGALLAALAIPAGGAVLASGLGLLLLAGIRNAWDMVIWIVIRRG
ncbi:MAG: hypothetical protein ACREFQ_05955 [Stellaceae bacterium]